MTKHKDYSSIRTHDELLKAISDINNEIEITSTHLDSCISNIRYKYSFAHLAEIAITRFQLFKNLFDKITAKLKNETAKS